MNKPNKILVVNGASYARPIDSLGEVTARVSEFMKSPKDFKLVLFTGGEDVDPQFYKDSSPSNICYFNTARDVEEKAIFEVALKNDILMTGICRGIQFLNVMDGGRLMHDLRNHAGCMHMMSTTTMDETILVNSLHHQMVVPNEDAIITGWSTFRRSRRYIGAMDKEEDYTGLEVEAVIFPKIKAFGVQYHPEMMDQTSPGNQYFKEMVVCALGYQWDDFVALYSPGEEKNDEIHATYSAAS